LQRFNLRIMAALALLPAFMLPMAAQAQSYQCRIPQNISNPPRVSRPTDERPRVRDIDGFVLAISWSPEFCKGREDDRRSATQCGDLDNAATQRRIGDFGFILHGLWPEARGSDYPRWCAPVKPLSPRIIAENLCAMPSAYLINRQWAKHGICLTPNPASFFRISRTMFNAVKYPDMDGLSRDDTLTIGRFREAFAKVNPGLTSDMVRIKANRRGWLQEVRICLARNYKPRACPSHIRRSRDSDRLNIWRGY
jgi:ribonuclease T2